MKSVERQTGIKPPELLELVELPDVFSDCWSWFLDLHNSRTSGMMAPNPISYSDIYSYFKLFSIEPYDWEIKIIKMFDSTALQIDSKTRELEAKNNKNKKKA